MIRSDLDLVLLTDWQQYSLECFHAVLQFLIEGKKKIKGFFSKEIPIFESYPKVVLNLFYISVPLAGRGEIFLAPLFWCLSFEL